MNQQFDSRAGDRFLALIREGRSFRDLGRVTGIGKETGYRWLRDAYLRFRSEGLDHAATQTELGFTSNNVEKWNDRFLSSTWRHHFQVHSSTSKSVSPAQTREVT